MSFRVYKQPQYHSFRVYVHFATRTASSAVRLSSIMQDTRRSLTTREEQRTHTYTHAYTYSESSQY